MSVWCFELTTEECLTKLRECSLKIGEDKYCQVLVESIKALTQMIQEKGHIALVSTKDQKIVGFYRAYEDALKCGLNKFGNVPFLIKTVQEVEETHFFQQRRSF